MDGTETRERRLAEALRANLRRRKTQARAQRDAAPAPAPDDATARDDADGAGLSPAGR